MGAAPVDHPRVERRLSPVLAVAAVMSAVMLGGYVAAASLSEPSGPPIRIGGVVTVPPLSGWELARRFDEPPGARLTRGSGNLDVAAAPFGGSSEELLATYVSGFLEPDATRLSVSSGESIHLGSGLRGIRAIYVGAFGDVHAPIEGQVTAVVAPSGTGVIFDGWAPSGLLQYVLDDVDRMVADSEIA